ncbi:MAG: RCC1 repeat-containing protein, partial [Acidimicrobiia bacterium]|nr:RCC1 repeat-containing protein [Acidimicrobiia bacterium]
MFGRRHHAQALLWCLVVATIATIFPIRNATEYLNNKEANAFGSSNAKYLSVGLDFACAITTSGGLMCWGNNDYGNLGDDTYSDRISPVAVSGLSSGVTAVAVGEYHTCALTSAGAVKCWGNNDRGQLGDGTRTTRTAPVAVSGLTSGVTAITAGEYHTCALTSAGAVKCWG